MLHLTSLFYTDAHVVCTSMRTAFYRATCWHNVFNRTPYSHRPGLILIQVRRYCHDVQAVWGRAVLSAGSCF